jgi:hypothetical protein
LFFFLNNASTARYFFRGSLPTLSEFQVVKTAK